MSTEYYHPAALFGGTWQQIKGYVLIGDLGDEKWTSTDKWGQPYRLGLTGGNTRAQTHSHKYFKASFTKKEVPVVYTGGPRIKVLGSDTSFKNTETETTNFSGAGSGNMPPYLVVYMWKRIA